MATKILKTAEELVQMIKSKLPHGHHDVEVKHDEQSGWSAHVTGPFDDNYDEATRTAKEAQDELRLMYDMMP